MAPNNQKNPCIFCGRESPAGKRNQERGEVRPTKFGPGIKIWLDEPCRAIWEHEITDDSVLLGDRLARIWAIINRDRIQAEEEPESEQSRASADH